jgi:hypothetical protein
MLQIPAAVREFQGIIPELKMSITTIRERETGVHNREFLQAQPTGTTTGLHPQREVAGQRVQPPHTHPSTATAR